MFRGLGIVGENPCATMMVQGYLFGIHRGLVKSEEHEKVKEKWLPGRRRQILERNLLYWPKY